VGIIGRSREMQRMRSARSSGPAGPGALDAGPAAGAKRDPSGPVATTLTARFFSPSAVKGGILPSGGSTMIEVRRLAMTAVARSRQNSL